jgi:hypothetical protein
MEARLFRHCVVRSALSRELKTLAVEDRVLGVVSAADGVFVVAEVMVFDMESIF